MNRDATKRGGFFVDEGDVLSMRPAAAPLLPRRCDPQVEDAPVRPPADAPLQAALPQRCAAWLEQGENARLEDREAAGALTAGELLPPWWRSPGRVLLVALAALIGAAGLFDAWGLLAAAFAESALLGTLFTALFGALAGAAGWTAWAVRQDLARLRSTDALRAQAVRILASGEGLELPAEDYLAALATHYAGDARVASPLERFLDDVDSSLPAQWQLERLSVEVFAPLDRVAFDTVKRHAQQTALLAMLSRVHFADFLIALWRSLALVRQIARTYGARPGALGTARLWRGVLRNVLYAEVSEVAADTLGQVLGGGVAAKFSAQAAQGVGMGLLIGRLGLEAIRACRPLPFTGREAAQPSLKVLGEAMMQLVLKTGAKS